MARFLFLVLLLAASLFGALAMGVAVYYYLTYALAFVLIGGLLWASWNLIGVTARVERRSLRSQVGKHLRSRLEVRSNTRLPKGWLTVREMGDLPGHMISRLVHVADKGGYSGEERTLCQKRGLFTVGPLEIESWDPLGIFKLRRRWGKAEHVVVYPAIVPLPRFQLFGTHLAGESDRMRRHGEQPSALASSVREYHHGDGVNRVHWATTARTSRLMVKQFDQGLSTNLWILLDLDARVQVGSGQESSDEIGVTIAASVAQKYASLDIPVGLAVYGDQEFIVRPNTSPNQMQRILEPLALARAQGKVRLAQAIQQISSYVGRYTTLLVITPSVEKEWQAALASLLDRGVAAVAVLIDPSTYGHKVEASQMVRQSLSSLGVPLVTVSRGQAIEQALALAPIERARSRYPHRVRAR